ncbi:MAG: PPC domain-containing protein [Chloroflexales bacterium]
MPADGRYYVRVRDAAGRGGVNYMYVIALIDESYGPTPTLVREICLDLFEADGLPEQARLITSNEIQEDRKLCPTGDADWVTFFAKAGKRYIIYTDTRRYRGRNIVNGETQAGADTTMILTDRDGVTLLDANDDIPGGSTLDSQIEFTPEVDGFYFVQVKNNGDIGNQFIRYDMVLLLCVPGQTDCGRTSLAGTPIVPITPLATGTPDREFNLDPTNTPRPTAKP